MNRVPDVDELRAFLHRMIAEARMMNDPARVDDLLDKLHSIDETREFLGLAISARAGPAAS